MRSSTSNAEHKRAIAAVKNLLRQQRDEPDRESET